MKDSPSRCWVWKSVLGLCSGPPGVHICSHLTTASLIVGMWCRLNSLHRRAVRSDLALQLLPCGRRVLDRGELRLELIIKIPLRGSLASSFVLCTGISKYRQYPADQKGQPMAPSVSICRYLHSHCCIRLEYRTLYSTTRPEVRSVANGPDLQGRLLSIRPISSIQIA